MVLVLLLAPTPRWVLGCNLYGAAGVCLLTSQWSLFLSVSLTLHFSNLWTLNSDAAVSLWFACVLN